MLAGIWTALLGMERVGVTENLFEIGGHSLLATQVVSQVRDAFKVEVPLRALFESPTIEELAKNIEERLAGEQGMDVPPITPSDSNGSAPLSYAQQRLWFLDQLQPGNSAYNVPGAMRLTGAIDQQALARSINEIVTRHEALRTVFATVGRTAEQRIQRDVDGKLSVTDLSALAEDDREKEARRLAAEEAQRPFDLTRGPLFRVKLLQMGLEDHVLLFSMHHIISDEWSMRILIKELGALYEAYSSGKESPLEPLSIQYSDFAVWQRKWLEGEVLDKQLEYWKQQLGVEPPVLELPTDRPRPPVQGHDRSSLSMRLSAGLGDQIKKLSMREGATLFMTLLAAFKVLLYRYTWQEQIVVGTPIANRNRAETEGLIGFFVNTLPLRTDLSGYPTFRELLGRVREVALGAYTHQDVPFEKLVEELHPERSLSHTPLFQNMFVLQNAPTTRLKLPGLKTRNMASGSGSAMFDLILMMTDTNDALTGTVLYDVDLFDASTIEQMLDHYSTILHEVTQNPDVRLTEIPILRDKEPGVMRRNSILQNAGEVGSFAF